MTSGLMAVPAARQTEEVITLTAQEICQACAGRLLAGGGGTPVPSVSTDTRAPLSGCLFVALKGDRFDGNEFAGEALKGGAIGVVAQGEAALQLAAEAALTGGNGAPEPVIVAVPDTGKALGQIASLVAGRSRARVVGITGSTGKTSTKDILSCLLEPQLSIVASQASYNNEVGVPLTLLQIRSDTQVAVVEMGMQAREEIAHLCAIASPSIAVITNIGPAHLEYAGSLKNIARGKAEIARQLPAGAGLVLPYGERLLEPFLEDVDARRLTFGFDTRADIHPSGPVRPAGGRLCLSLSCLDEELDICFNFNSRYQLLNAMAAIGVYTLLELPLAGVAEAAGNIRLPDMRGEIVPLPGEGILINDCYNANPMSMRAALEHLASASEGRRSVAVLGDMAELGRESQRLHRQVGAAAAKLGIDLLVAVGGMASGFIDGARAAGSRGGIVYFSDRETAVSGLPDLIRPGDAVLVKGSRFMGLEQVSELLAGGGNMGRTTGARRKSR